MKRWRLICPYCHKANDTHDSLDDPGAQPGDGDLSLCIGCGQFGVFDLRERCLRLPNIGELGEIAFSPEAQHARRAWEAMNKARSH